MKTTAAPAPGVMPGSQSKAMPPAGAGGPPTFFVTAAAGVSADEGGAPPTGVSFKGFPPSSGVPAHGGPPPGVVAGMPPGVLAGGPPPGVAAGKPGGLPPWLAGPPMPLEQQWKAMLDAIKTDSLVLAPETPDKSKPSCLLIWLPGAMTQPTSYQAVAEQVVRAAKEEFAPGMDLTLIVPAIDSMKMMMLSKVLDGQAKKDGAAGSPPVAAPPPWLRDPLALPTSSAAVPEQLLQVVMDHATKAAGFTPQLSMVHRPTNVAVLAHSFAGPSFSDAAFKFASATIMAQSYTSIVRQARLAPSCGWLTHARPTMYLLGELDGQMLWPAMLHEVAASAWTAEREGAAYAATFKPFVVVPGVNHSQVCSTPLNTQRGDCPTPVPPETTLAAMGRAVAAFLAVHFAAPGSTKPVTEQAPEAVRALVEAAKTTAALCEPYAAANGIPDICKAWQAGEALDADPTTIARAAQPMPSPLLFGPNEGVETPQGAYTATKPSELAPVAGALTYCTPLVLPAQVAEAEREVADMQVRAIKAAVAAGLLPESVAARLRVRVEVHPHALCFVHSQPTISLAPGGAVVLRVHAFMHWPALDKPDRTPLGLYCASHDLWAKLKGVAGLCLEVCALLGLEPPALDNCAGHEMSAQSLNQDALHWALEAVGPERAARYEQLGVPLQFSPDTYTPTAAQWAMPTRIAYKVNQAENAPGSTGAAGEGGEKLPAAAGKPVVCVQSPVHNPVADKGAVAPLPQDPAERRFYGSMYVKVMSKAQALEWVVLGALRQAAQPAEAGCMWGGHAATTNSFAAGAPAPGGMPPGIPASVLAGIPASVLASMPPGVLAGIPPSVLAGMMPPGVKPAGMPPGAPPAGVMPGGASAGMPPGVTPSGIPASVLASMPPGVLAGMMPPGVKPAGMPPGVMPPAGMMPGGDSAGMPPGVTPSGIPASVLAAMMPGGGKPGMPAGVAPAAMMPGGAKAGMPPGVLPGDDSAGMPPGVMPSGIPASVLASMPPGVLAGIPASVLAGMMPPGAKPAGMPPGVAHGAMPPGVAPGAMPPDMPSVAITAGMLPAEDSSSDVPPTGVAGRP